MRRTLVEGTRFVKLRPEFVEACDGNPCAALLLDVFDYRATAVENGVGTEAWARATMPWLSEWLGGGFGERAIRTALELLVDKGFVERRKDPERKLDQSWQYRLNVGLLDRALASLRSQGSEPDIRRDHAGASDVEEEEELQEEQQGPTDVDRLWATFLMVCKPVNAQLTASRTRVLRRALNEAPLDLCERAVHGLDEYVKRTGKGNRDISRIFVTRPGGSALADQIEWWAHQSSTHQPQRHRNLPPHVRDGLITARDHRTARWDDTHQRWFTNDETINAAYLRAEAFALERFGLRVVWREVVPGEGYVRLEFQEVTR